MVTSILLTLAIRNGTSLSVGVPVGWLVDTSGRDGTFAMALGPLTVGQFRPNLTLVIQDEHLSGQEELLAVLRRQIANMVGENQIRVDRPVQGSSYAHEFEWSSVAGGHSLTFLQRILFVGGSAYTATTVALSTEFHRLRPLFESSLGAFSAISAEHVVCK